MISLRLALGRLEDRRLPNRVCPHETPDILGIDLNCSESRLFTPACRAPNTDVGGPVGSLQGDQARLEFRVLAPG
jgi:hypothetical protein